MSLIQTGQKRAYVGWTSNLIRVFSVCGAVFGVQVVAAHSAATSKASVVAQGQTPPMPLRQVTQANPTSADSTLFSNPSMLTNIVIIHTGGATYYIPRNYIYYMDSSYPILRIIYPDFKPLSESTAWCLQKNLPKVPQGCLPLELRLHGGSSPKLGEHVYTNREMLTNSLRNIPQRKLNGPYGYTIYAAGPSENEIRIYTKPDGRDIIFVKCFGRTPLSTCDDYVQLRDGNFIRFFIEEARIGSVEDIVSLTRKLFNKFSSGEEVDGTNNT